MTATYVLGGLAAVFLVMGVARLARDGGKVGPRSKAWLIVGVIFAAVSAWLWASGSG